MRKLTVGILMGGKSSEHEVSLSTGANIIEALNKNRYRVVPIEISKQNQWKRKGKAMTVEKALEDVGMVFNALHGEYGEDGIIQGLLEALEIPYTGSGVRASSLAMDKVKSRVLFKISGLNVPNYQILKSFKDNLRLSFPGVIKPVFLGSSVGVSIVKNKKEFKKALDKALKHCPKVLFEEYIEGKEVTCGILDNFQGEEHCALPVTEIVPPKGRFFDYQVKYNGSTQEITPARIDKNLTREVQEVAKSAHKILGCYGYSRTDMIIKADSNKIYVLEVNTLPGMTKASLYPQAAEAAGIEFPRLLDKIIELGLKRGNMTLYL